MVFSYCDFSTVVLKTGDNIKLPVKKESAICKKAAHNGVPVKKKIRVLINGPIPPPLGGMATYCHDYMCTDLPRHFDVILCRSIVLKGIVRARGLLRLALRALNSLLITAVWMYMLIIKRPHIAHVHTNSWTGFYVKSLLALLARATGAKTVMHVHGAEFGRFYESMGPFYKRLTKGLLNSNCRVVVLSNQWRQFFESIGIQCERMTVMPNSVFMPDQIGQGPERNKPCLLYMSAFEHRKGVGELMTAIEKWPEVFQKCTIVLAGPKANQWDEIAKRASDLPEPESIEMPGSLMGAAKDLAYRRADVYVLPSHAEGMPIGLLEAMSYGLACITTPVGGIPDVIKNMQNGLLVDPGDTESLACAINLLIADRDLRMRLGTAARRTVEEHYNWQDRAEEIGKLYLQLLPSWCSEERFGARQSCLL